MVLETIYVVRHGFRSNWVVDHETGEYLASVPGPTSIPSDPALASYGVLQAKQLGEKIVTLDPPVDVIYSSPFYRCLQTLRPAVDTLFAQRKAGGKIRVENGLGEFYGLARFDHPSPAPLSELHTHFPDMLDDQYKVILVPSVNGESIQGLQERVAYVLRRLITDLDNDPRGPKSVLICTHAATMICIGRALTGQMPDDVGEEDFLCYTCSLSKFERKDCNPRTIRDQVAEWDPRQPNRIPSTGWLGMGVEGGWNCTINGDCSFLSGGEERGWRFSGDEDFLSNPNGFNDAANARSGMVEGESAEDGDKGKTSRL